MIKVSVIMPIYNAEKYLDMALGSVINQTLKDIEIICVDDGSTDHTGEMLSRYKQRDGRIIILKQSNRYAGVARNFGMTIARGKYLSFLDADDYFEPEMLEKAYLCAEENKADVVVFGGKCFVDDLKDAYVYTSLLNEKFIPDGDGFDNSVKHENILNFTTPAPWNKLFRADFIYTRNLKFQNSKRANDLYFVDLALALADKIGVVREPLICYRRENKNSLQGTNNQSPEQFAKAFIDLQSKLIELKIYDYIEKSFHNLALSSCIYNLESLTDATSFEKLYFALRNEYFVKLGIVGSKEEEYYNKNLYNKYLFIMSKAPLEYWMYRYWESTKLKISKKYLFPFTNVEHGSSVILYGAGKVGIEFYQQIQKTEYCTLQAWVDKKIKRFNAYEISCPESVDWNKCDYIVIAIESERVVNEIVNTLIDHYAVSEDKIVWENPVL